MSYPKKIGEIILGSKRLPEEKFEDYKKRRTNENTIVDHYLKGKYIWDSGFKDKDDKTRQIFGTRRLNVQSK